MSEERELARIIRWVDRGTIPGEGILSLYDKSTNTLIIDRQYYNELTTREQRLLCRTEEPCIVMEYREAARIVAR